MMDLLWTKGQKKLTKEIIPQKMRYSRKTDNQLRSHWGTQKEKPWKQDAGVRANTISWSKHLREFHLKIH